MSGILMGIRIVKVFQDVFVVNDMIVLVINNMGIMRIIGKYLLINLVMKIFVFSIFRLLFNVSESSIIVISGRIFFMFLKLVFIVLWWVNCLLNISIRQVIVVVRIVVYSMDLLLLFCVSILLLVYSIKFIILIIMVIIGIIMQLVLVVGVVFSDCWLLLSCCLVFVIGL